MRCLPIIIRIKRILMQTNEQILRFLRALSANNHREWFQAHKEEYDVLRMAFMDEVQVTSAIGEGTKVIMHKKLSA